MKIPNASPPYKLVVFDFDGTLADSLGWLTSVMPETAARFQFSYAGPEKHDYLRSLDAGELIRFTSHLSPATPAAVRRRR